MTDGDLHTMLVRAAGGPADRPALDDLWTLGRRRRLRTRVLATAAAAVVVLALAAGAAALASTGGDGDEDLVAGPGGADRETSTSAAPAGGSGPGTGTGEAAGLQFRPVLQEGLPYDAAAEATGDDPCSAGVAGSDEPSPLTIEADATVVIPDRPDRDEAPVACTRVGPAGFDGTALSQAEARSGASTGDEWIVVVRVGEGERSRADELFDACAAAATACPSGQLAIVLDGVVISAPTVNDPDLADDEFVISGGGPDGFTEGAARDLADRLQR